MKIVEDADKAPAKKKPARKKTTKIKEIQWNIAGYARKLNTFGHTFFMYSIFSDDSFMAF